MTMEITRSTSETLIGACSPGPLVTVVVWAFEQIHSDIELPQKMFSDNSILMCNCCVLLESYVICIVTL